MKFLGVFLGILAGVMFSALPGRWLYPSWEELAVLRSVDIQEDKFISTFKKTFESRNPRSEYYDKLTNTRPDSQSLKSAYKDFEREISKISKSGCPTVLIVVPSRWDGEMALNRKMEVFDLQGCKD